jgi:hypothetical protein
MCRQPLCTHPHTHPQVYVVGSDIIVEPRATLTAAGLAALASNAAAVEVASPGGGGAAVGPGAQGRPQSELVLIVGRASSQPLSAAPRAGTEAAAAGGSGGGGGGRGGGSEAGSAPPLWALREAAARLGAALGLSVFNFDVIVPERQGGSGGGGGGGGGGSRGGGGGNGSGGRGGGGSGGSDSDGRGSPATTCAGGEAVGGGELLCLVVDVNYFPGFDKAGPAAQALLGAHLRARALQGAAARAAAAAEPQQCRAP